ncbi:type II secretion system protein GspM [Xanthobacter sp. AM11]|uniref:type II secretion system protein GspM n=1 Tax=Xanthobacter sp. AM11 TaxID=3380643 RepID=UPI0039BFD6F8
MMSAPRSARAMTLAALGYGVLVAGLCSLAVGAVTDLLARRAALAEAQELLDRLDGRKAHSGPGSEAASAAPMLEGESVTVAGAALVERVTAAVDRAGGRITSARVDLAPAAFGPGFVAVAVSVEIAPPDLQILLYDIEAGQPFLFVDPLLVQGQQEAGEEDEARMQATLTVYGRWQGAR